MTDDNQTDSNLARRIEELEALLAEQRMKAGMDPEHPRRAANIPVLDEEVSPEDYSDDDMAADSGQFSQQVLADMADRLEEKFATELDQTIRILKNNLRENILRELDKQMQHRNDTGKSASGLLKD